MFWMPTLAMLLMSSMRVSQSLMLPLLLPMDLLPSQLLSQLLLPLPSNDSKSFCVDIIYEEYLFESNKKSQKVWYFLLN
jgi:hypothetical protein